MPEKQFGPYRLVHQIAVGGMAEIHLAKTRGLAGFEKYVALKMIHPNFSSDEQFIQMLIDEAKITVQLQHVNVAQTFDLGRVGDTYYITMEFVDGSDLYQLLRKGSERRVDVPVDVAAFTAKEIATGLDYAHRKRDVSGRPLRIVHRDVSPQNVLISHAGEVKLVDFGIAKATMRVRQTAVGVIKGKYYYMSPEQAWGDQVDHRTDIFSAGIVLYEMLTGQMLYLEEDLHRLLEMVRKANIAPPTRLRKDVPPQLERIVMHALEKTAGDRYQTAGDFAADLERFLHAYSPVFSASKVSKWFRTVVDTTPLPPRSEPEPIPTLSPATNGNSRVTKRFTRDNLFLKRSEFTDENSVIFQLSEVSPKGETLESAAPKRKKRARGSARTFDRPGRADSRLPTANHTRPTKDQHTMNLEGIDLEELVNEERTIVSEPPRFSLVPSQRPHTDSDYPSDDNYDPTIVEGVIIPAEPSPSAGDRATSLRGESETAVGRAVTSEAKPSPPPAAVSHPVLAANTQPPAVSALQSRRRSRRTPAEGVAARGPSILSTIVGSASGRSSKKALPGKSAKASESPVRSRTTPLPKDDAPVKRPEPAAVPPMYAIGVEPSPELLQVDELPDAYKLGSGNTGSRWLLRTTLAAVFLAVGVGIGTFVMKQERPAGRDPLNIRSSPPNATVAVDGQILENKTPVLFEAEPGRSYAIEVSKQGFQSKTKQVGPTKDVVEFELTAYRLFVTSEPPAEVYIDGKAFGATPQDLTGEEIDARITREIVLKAPNYEELRVPIEWGDQTTIELKNLELKPIE